MAATKSLEPFFLFTRIFGLFPFSISKTKDDIEFKVSRKLLAYTIFVFVTLIVLQSYVIWYMLNVEVNYNQEVSTQTVLNLSYYSFLVSVFLTFTKVLVKKESCCFWLNNLNTLCSILTAKSLSTVKHLYFVMLTYTGCLLLVLGFLEIDIQKFYSSYPALSEFDTNLTATIAIITYYFSVWEVRMFLNYFVVFNKLLHAYYQDVNSNLKNGGKNFNRGNWLTFLRDLRHQDLYLKDFLDFLHSFFIPVISLQLLWGYFTAILSFNQKISSKAIHVLWVAYLVCDVVTVLGVCHATEQESLKMAHYIHSILIHCDDRELKEEVEFLSLQVQHVKMEFNACGFFKLNLSLLFTMIGSLTSYTIILLQHRDESNVNRICSRKINCTGLLKKF